MISMEEKLREKLRREADGWIEKELKERMAHAEMLIRRQAQDACSGEEASEHIRKASPYAMEEIRKDLEFEASGWVEGELKKRLERIEDKK